MTPAEAEALVAAVRAVLADAIAAGGSSLRDYRQADGELGYFQHSFAVYGREGAPCPRGAAARSARVVQAGRSSFFCPACQALNPEAAVVLLAACQSTKESSPVAYETLIVEIEDHVAEHPAEPSGGAERAERPAPRGARRRP